MSKRMLLLAMLGVALCASPGTASAQEIHLEGITSFTGIGCCDSLIASGEPVITCKGSDAISGTVSAGGTTGNISIDFVECHTTVFGITAKCRTAGSALDNTILSSGVFHLITISSGVRGVLLTPVVTTIVCAGISNTITGGRVIGTILSPACGVESKTVELAFTSTGSTQNHKSYTGTTYNLTAQTSGGPTLEAGFNSAATLTSTTAGKLNCT